MATPLTATEARVAGLVANGRTNQEIAEVLALQPDSVEGNLLRACEKLGVRSRTELALMLTVNSGPIGSTVYDLHAFISDRDDEIEN